MNSERTSHTYLVFAGWSAPRDSLAWSRAALDAPLFTPTPAAGARGMTSVLRVAVLDRAARVLGAFGRNTAATGDDAWRRGSGGPEVRVGPGTVHVALALASPRVAPVEADARRIVNRAVRPLLRALTKEGTPAHYFGRDWVAIRHRPAAWVGFGHDGTTGRALFEAFVAVAVPFAPVAPAGPPTERFRGKEPGTLEGILGRSVDPERLARSIAEAYGGALGEEGPIASDVCAEAAATADPEPIDPPWASTCDEAIGIVGAGRDRAGVFRVGGDLLASRDAIAALERAAAALPSDGIDERLGPLVNETLGRPDVALDGVRSLESVRSVVAAALRAS